MGGESEGHSYANATNNCFIKGPLNGVPPFNLGNLNYHIYQNRQYFRQQPQWTVRSVHYTTRRICGPPDFKSTPFPYPAVPTVPANTLVNELLPSVGASLPYRDYADYYVINEVRSFGEKRRTDSQRK